MSVGIGMYELLIIGGIIAAIVACVFIFGGGK